jgi:hypothetical protein
MQQKTKKQYAKPRVTAHGSVEQVTGWVGGGCGEFLGGSEGSNFALACAVNGPADFGS